MNASNRAFSLVELMCAILILGVALAGLARGITSALSSSKEAELQTSAAWIAAGQVEILRAEGYVAEGAWEGECGPELRQYRWRQSVERTEIDGLFDVAVVVEHAQSGTTIYELRTRLFDPPLLEGSREDPRRDRDERRRL